VLDIVGSLPVTPTVRQIYYLLVSEALIFKSEAAYKSLVRQLGRMRKGGMLPYDALIDGTGERKMVQTFGAPSEALAYAAAVYRRDVWATQPMVCEVWAEADTLSQMLWQVTSPLAVPCVVTRGNPSLSLLYTSAAVIAKRWARGQRTRIVYVGDFDPAGMDMSDNLHARLEEVGAPADAVTVRRVALTQELIIAYRLPSHEPRHLDRRTPEFVARYGVACVEVDALPPAVLAEVVEEAIYDAIEDLDAWEQEQDQQQYDHQALRYDTRLDGRYVDAEAQGDEP
jgi:hypothetical protein